MKNKKAIAFGQLMLLVLMVVGIIVALAILSGSTDRLGRAMIELGLMKDPAKVNAEKAKTAEPIGYTVETADKAVVKKAVDSLWESMRVCRNEMAIPQGKNSCVCPMTLPMIPSGYVIRVQPAKISASNTGITKLTAFKGPTDRYGPPSSEIIAERDFNFAIPVMVETMEGLSSSKISNGPTEFFSIEPYIHLYNNGGVYNALFPKIKNDNSLWRLKAYDYDFALMGIGRSEKKYSLLKTKAPNQIGFFICKDENADSISSECDGESEINEHIGIINRLPKCIET